jgi:tetratricopeptide (TPR) repeat protein
MRYFDSHAHYYDERFESEYESGVDNLIDALLKASVSYILNVGTSPATSRLAIEQAKKFKGIVSMNQVTDRVEFEKAQVLFASKRFAEAISSAREAIKYDSNQGEPYLLLGQVYAAVDPYPGDKVLNSTKYWAAVDKLQQAKKVEPELAEKANTLINSFRKHYPNADDVFMHDQLKVGEPFTVGGVIGETVICRE